MSTGQLIIIILAISFFATIAVNMNKIYTAKAETFYENHIDSNALALGEYLIEEAWTKNFDEVSVSSNPQEIPEAFTGYQNFGKEGNESYDDSPYFDDVDDYHNMRKEFLFAENKYIVESHVYYTNLNGDSLLISTNSKMVVFDIFDVTGKNPVTVKHMFSYMP